MQLVYQNPIILTLCFSPNLLLLLVLVRRLALQRFDVLTSEILNTPCP